MTGGAALAGGAGLGISPGLREALARWLDHLRALDGAAAHTLTAYTRDVARFLTFLGQHQGGSAGLASVTGLAQADLRAWMAAERGRGVSARSLA